MRGRVIPLSVLAAITIVACSSGDGAAESTSTTTATTTASTADDEGTENEVQDDPAADEPTTVATTGEVDDGDEVDTIDPTAFEPATIEWEPFDETVDIGTLDVPIDYREPDGPTFELFLARYNALEPDNRIGSLLVNPGGPGFGGTDLAVFASSVFDRQLLDHFDIVGWDPRGTGESDPAIDCISDFDPYVAEIDSTPDDDAERESIVETARDFADRCADRNAEIIEHVGTNNSARDMDTIRRALGEDQVSYFGFSYGSDLGGVWATMFPDTVRAAVLDGAADPTADPIEAGLQQLEGFNSSLSAFLSACADDEECAFHNDGDPTTALESLLVELDQDPVPTESGRPPANRDVAINGIQQAMYSERFWPALAESLDDAQDGDGSGLLALHDAYFQRAPDGTYGNELEAFQAISCADQVERPTVAEVEAESERYHDVAPLLAPEGSIGFFCTFFPPAVEPRATITGAGAGPIVVIGTTGDPATPLASTERMAESLEDGRLVIVDANEHTGYGENRCVVEIVNEYLVDLEPPDDGTDCG